MRDPDEVRILSPTAILGYGYPLASLEAGLREDPDFIGVDAGSTDPGPYYLGAGVSFTSAKAVRRDLGPLVRAGKARGIPVIVGSAGGAGGDPHLEWTWQILTDIAREEKLDLRVALIHAELEPSVILRAFEEGRLRSLSSSPRIERHDIERSTRIVAQMGPEPIQAALAMGVDVVLAGRSCDVSVFAALPLARGFDPGVSIHAAKIIECGAYCAEPASASDCILAFVRNDHFLLMAPNPDRRVTVASAISHTLYEQSHPYLIAEPLGVVDVSAARFVDAGDGSMRVSGSVFTPAGKYTVKVEAAAKVGYRSVTIGGIRDPAVIRNLDALVDAARLSLADLTNGWERPHGVYFHAYGRDAVMGSREDFEVAPGHEVGIAVDVVGPSQAEADEACAVARSAILHGEYPGRRAAGGNVAFPFSPHDVAWGPVYEFSVYHLMEIDDPLALFPIEVRTT